MVISTETGDEACERFFTYVMVITATLQGPLIFTDEKHLGSERTLSKSAQAAVTKHDRLGGLNNKYSFLTVLEARGPRSGGQDGWVLVRALFLICKWPPSCCSFIWWRER